MCGIYGCSLAEGITDGDIQVAERCVAALHHRGPDGKGLWHDRDRGLLLGHTRLAIIDLSARNSQPFRIGRHVLAYNGELYNFREIRRELEGLGVAFETSGDTEVFLRALIQWQDRALDRFDGMFAFALWNGEILTLGTDPFGEKPLYLYHEPRGTHFCSEIGPLRQSFELRRGLSTVERDQFLGLGFILAPGTGYQDVEKIAPGTVIRVSGDQIQRRRYWHPAAERASRGGPITGADLDEIHDCLVESVRKRVVADVDVGLYLSSGVDSALIASIMKKELGLPLKAFTVRFESSEVDDESTAAGEIAAFLGIEHEVVQGSLRGGVSEVFGMLGELNDNITVLSAYAMSRAVSPRIKVALCGIGGDEMFYGYNRYETIHRWRRLFGLPRPVRGALWRLLRLVFPQRNRIAEYLRAGTANAFLRLKTGAAFAYNENHRQFMESLAGELRELHPDVLGAVRLHDILHSMPNSYIPNMERGSMRASIEVRSPFLSRDLFRRLQKHPPREYLRFGRKWVARDLLRRYLPGRLVDLPKRGFTQPRGEFLQALDRRELAEMLAGQGLAPDVLDSEEPGWVSLKLRLMLMHQFLQGVT